MSFAALMVHFDGKANSYHRLQLAIDLANRFEAALIGVAGRSYLPPFLANGDVAQQKTDEPQEMAHLLAQIGQKFHTAAKQVVQLEWRGIVDDTTHLVTKRSTSS